MTMKKYIAEIHLTELDEGMAWHTLHKMLKEGRLLENVKLKDIEDRRCFISPDEECDLPHHNFD